jgi:hypothetical protein
MIPVMSFSQKGNIDGSVFEKFKSVNPLHMQTLQELAQNIKLVTSSKEEQLQMLLLWAYHNMAPDSVRFLKGGSSLTTDQAFRLHTGLCDEYTNITSDFCHLMQIPCIRIEGYVKYAGFKSNDTFEESNHAWNAVYIDSTWLLCDLFWSTYTLRIISSIPCFIQQLNTQYYLAPPSTFITTHLPADPVFQFSNFPITIDAFTSVENGIDTTIRKMDYTDYNKSITRLLKLNNNERGLYIAQHAYAYNKRNPNILIIQYYNLAADIIHHKTSDKVELNKAKEYLTSALSLIAKTTIADIKALQGNCLQGLDIINRRINALEPHYKVMSVKQ